MNANEKQLRYQAQNKLTKLQHSGAKPAVIERLRRSMSGERQTQRKGLTFGPKRG